MKLNIKSLVDQKGMNRNQLAKELKIGYIWIYKDMI